MINRDDMLELTRRMTVSRSCFDRVAGCYFDADGEIDDTFNIHFLKLTPAEKTKNLALAKEIPFSKTNDALKEVRLSTQAMGPGGMAQLLTGIGDCGLKNDLLMELLYEQIGKAAAQIPALSGNRQGFGAYIFHGSYDVPTKTSDGAVLEDSETVYDFIIAAVSPLEVDYDMGKPVYGFLYPAFSDRVGDRASIDIYERVVGTFPKSLRALL